MYPPGTIAFQPNSVENIVTKDKGTQLMGNLLLSEYGQSPNLIQYMKAYVEEVDFLFESIESVYVGQFIENATGKQLDVIGEILDQSRSINLGVRPYFGFQGATGNIAGLADSAAPAEGGVFKSVQEEFEVTPLDDFEYRRLLLAKALVLNAETASINLAYYCISTLLARVPSTFELEVTGVKQVTLNLASSEVTDVEAALINYFARYMMPTGTVFSINAA
jgi:hypothetical protein